MPYANAYRPAAPYKGEEILRDLKSLFREFRPTKVFVSHPADHNQDHRALYLFTRVALWDIESEMRPLLFPYLIHFGRWPKPKGYHPDEHLSPPDFFGDIAWKTHPLTPAEVATQYAAIQAHASQFRASRAYLSSFVRPDEIFGDWPELALSAPAGSAPGRNVSERYTERELSEQLLEEEKTQFVGIESRLVGIEDDHLVVTINLSRPLAKAVEMSLSVFGYRPDRPFETMPKVQVRSGAVGHRIYDDGTEMRSSDIRVARHPKQIETRIPLRALDHPDRILTDARTYLEDVPLDWISWRTLRVLSAPGEQRQNPPVRAE